MSAIEFHYLQTLGLSEKILERMGALFRVFQNNRH